MKSYWKYWFCVSIIILISNNSLTQTTGTFMNVNDIELGFSYKMFHREFHKEFVDGGRDAIWDIPSVYGKYKINEWLNLNLEGAVYFDLINQIPGRNYISYHIGCGYEAMLYRVAEINVLSVAQLDYNINYDRSKYKVHKNQQYVFLGLKIEKIFEIDKLKIGLNITPAYIYNKLTDESPVCTASSESKNNMGLAFGFSVLTCESLQLAGQVVYANYIQPQFGIGYIF